MATMPIQIAGAGIKFDGDSAFGLGLPRILASASGENANGMAATNMNWA